MDCWFNITLTINKDLPQRYFGDYICITSIKDDPLSVGLFKYNIQSQRYTCRETLLGYYKTVIRQLFGTEIKDFELICTCHSKDLSPVENESLLRILNLISFPYYTKPGIKIYANGFKTNSIIYPSTLSALLFINYTIRAIEVKDFSDLIHKLFQSKYSGLDYTDGLLLTIFYIYQFKNKDFNWYINIYCVNHLYSYEYFVHQSVENGPASFMGSRLFYYQDLYLSFLYNFRDEIEIYTRGKNASRLTKLLFYHASKTGELPSKFEEELSEENDGEDN
jgi:hypothetical protein